MWRPRFYTLAHHLSTVWSIQMNIPQQSIKWSWLLKADDDTYVIVENLKLFLAEYSPFKPYYFGKRFKPYGEYMSGGGGYVISREALLRVGVALKKNDGKICSESSSGGSEDVIMGSYIGFRDSQKGNFLSLNPHTFFR